jgi:hypothetical protein
MMDAFEIRQPDRIAVDIHKTEIRRREIKGYESHR